MMLVSLVGAGPGDPGLLTIKAQQAIENADVIIYDALANDSFLKFAEKRAEKIYVGKVADQHALPQQEINNLLVLKAREGEGKRVVRLKGGDPFIFGRGGEEAEFLSKNGIPFEIIPGISSAIAVPAYAGISLTHRGYASSVTILTGHENPEKISSSHDWSALVKSNSTLVIVMGMRNIKSIIENLVLAGMDPDMPSAVIYRGTTPFQKSVIAPLNGLEEAVKKASIRNPALIVVGKVIELAPELAWFEKKPLLGRTIVVTRATEQASGLSEMLIKLGANVLQCPAIKIIPLNDYSALDEAISQLSKYDWTIFTSVNGVKYFWKRLNYLGKDSRSLAHSKIAAIGPATAQALENKGIIPDVVPKRFVGEEVAKSIIDYDNGDIKNQKILIPRAANARVAIVEILAKASAFVDVIPVYLTVADDNCAAAILKKIERNEIDCITFASSSTVKNLLNLLPADILGKSAVKLAAIGPITEETLRENNLNADIMPDEYTIPALVNAIEGFFKYWMPKHV